MIVMKFEHLKLKWPVGRKFIRPTNGRKKTACILLVVIIAGVSYLVLGQKNSTAPDKKSVFRPEQKNDEVKTDTPTDISDFGLDIKKISVWSPIISNVDEVDETAYLKALEGGVALSKSLAKNPTENGSMFLFGHSRYYKNKAGDYKEVFEELNKLSAGNEFSVFYKKKIYNYQVTDSKEVAKDDFSIRDATPDNPNDKTITIMTCWPPGTTEYRWIIFAKQI